MGHHLIPAHKGDTISGHAYRHVPRPLLPDARAAKLAEQKAQLEEQGIALQDARDYRQAAADMDRHASDLGSQGIALPGTWKAWTPDEHASHARYAEETITRALESGKATTEAETHDGAGQVWKPERAAMHRDIVHRMLEQDQGVPSGRRSVIIGGIPSPQRDRAARAIASEKDHVHVSVGRVRDEMVRRGMVPEVKGLSPAEASLLVHGEAEHVTGLLAREAARRGKNVALHTAMSDHEAVRSHAESLRQAGHSVHAAFVHVDPAKAADSHAAAHRVGHEAYRRQMSPGAKYLPPALVRAADAGNGETVNSRSFGALKPSLGSWEHWDTTKGEPRRIASGGERKDHGIPAPEELLRLTADSAVRLSAIIGWLEKGHITLADACERLRRLGVPKGRRRSAAQVLGADANGDLPAHDPSSFAEVSSAYVAGRITRHQYEQLAQAVSQS